MDRFSREGFLSETPQGVLLSIKVLPNASKTLISELRGDCLRIKVASAPVKGKANKECQRLLADFFKIKRSQVVFKQGEKSRLKCVLLEGVSKEEVIKRLKV